VTLLFIPFSSLNCFKLQLLLICDWCVAWDCQCHRGDNRTTSMSGQRHRHGHWLQTAYSHCFWHCPSLMAFYRQL